MEYNPIQEQRLTVRLIKQWELIRKGKPLPDIRHLNPTSMEDIWPYCCRIDVDNRGQHCVYRYEYMGGPVVNLYGADLTGMMVDHRIMEFPGSVIHRKLDEVVATKSILKDHGHLLNKQGRMVKYRACFLPFGNDKEGLTHVVIGLTCHIS